MKTPLTPAQLAKRLRLLANDMQDISIALQLDGAWPLSNDRENFIHAAELQGASIAVREWADAIEQPAKA
jgi:hypothetical protein